MTKEIKINWKDKVYAVLVDDDCYTLLSRHTWYIMYSGSNKDRPYAFAELYSKPKGEKRIKRMFYMHQMVTGSFAQTDHRNGNTLDNRFDNLRRATHSQNGANCRKQVRKSGKPCSSKHKGVTKWKGKYRAVIRCEGKTYQLGTYIKEDDAGRAYNKKAKELFGEYAYINNC